MESLLQIKKLTRNHDEFTIALHRVFDLPPPHSNNNLHPHVDHILENHSPESANPLSKNSMYLYGAYLNNELIASSLAIDSPGSTSMAFISTQHTTEESQRCAAYALSSLLTEAWERRLSLVEILLMPGSNITAKIATQAGFRFITRLLYLRRRNGTTTRISPVANDLEWINFSSTSEALFANAIELSYAQSLDCPELTGIRPTEDVLLAHRSVGEYDPSLWWVATRSGIPAGVMLLSRIKPHNALEIVYMGVSQAARGSGVADALLDRAITVSIDTDASELALAVDRRNDPARRMYARWGFTEFSARDAWIASPSQF